MKTSRNLGLALACALAAGLARPAAAQVIEVRRHTRTARGAVSVGVAHRVGRPRAVQPRVTVTARSAPARVHREVRVTVPPRRHWGCPHCSRPIGRCGTPARCGPVITVYRGAHRRIVQPRIPGHPAVVQVWRGHCGWTTVGPYPSIW